MGIHLGRARSFWAMSVFASFAGTGLWCWEIQNWMPLIIVFIIWSAIAGISASLWTCGAYEAKEFKPIEEE